MFLMFGSSIFIVISDAVRKLLALHFFSRPPSCAVKWFVKTHYGRNKSNKSPPLKNVIKENESEEMEEKREKKQTVDKSSYWVQPCIFHSRAFETLDPGPIKLQTSRNHARCELTACPFFVIFTGAGNCVLHEGIRSAHKSGRDPLENVV